VPFLALLLVACASTTVTEASNPDADAVLLSHVPAAIAGTCTSQEPAEVTRRAQVSCHPGGAIGEATYILFDGLASMDRAYDGQLASFPDTPAGDCTAAPGRGTYTIDGVDSGRIFCNLMDGKAFMVWTDTRFAILTVGLSTSTDFGPVYDWWATDAGPVEGTGSPAPTPTNGGVPGTQAPATPPSTTGPKVPSIPFSKLTGARIHQVVFATGVDPVARSPIGIADAFLIGTERILALVAWDSIEVGATLDVKLFRGDRLMAEQRVSPNNPDKEIPTSDFDGGFAIPFAPDGGFAEGFYTVQLDYDGLPEQVASFNVNETGDGAPVPANMSLGPSGTQPDLGPVPYADPARVLVVTRSSILRQKMGGATDSVLAAAAAVGTVHDLDSDLGTLPAGAPVPPAATISIVRNLLAGGTYRYLLILGNDDAVPMGHVDLPDSVDFTVQMQYEKIPGDYIVSDDPYTDLDGDALGIPDLPVARIPSSDDPGIMLTQLGEVQPLPATAFALVNEVRRSFADGPLSVINSITPTTLYYSPPTLSDKVPQTNQSTARFVYILLHGSGSDTTTWSGEVQRWTPLEPGNPLGEYVHEERNYSDSLSVPEAGAPGAVVNVGACFGAYVLDTPLDDTHKTRDNSLALKFLAAGSRAFIADTHLSISTDSEPGKYISARTGFEILLWQRIKAGATAIDAFFGAKVELGQLIAAQYADADGNGFADAPLAGDKNYLTVHEMIYMGRP
jgi:hypothetical protein